MINLPVLCDLTERLMIFGFLGMAILRALMMYAQGTPAVIFDFRRSFREKFFDLCFTSGVLLWGYVALSHGHNVFAAFLPAYFNTPMFESEPGKLTGLILMLLSNLGYVVALIHMGHSWRIGIDRKAPGKLVTSGIYALTRNPIYCCFLLLILGSAFVQTRPLLCLIVLFNIAMLHALILREEEFLREHFGKGYVEYCKKTGRYFGF